MLMPRAACSSCSPHARTADRIGCRRTMTAPLFNQRTIMAKRPAWALSCIQPTRRPYHIAADYDSVRPNALLLWRCCTLQLPSREESIVRRRRRGGASSLCTLKRPSVSSTPAMCYEHVLGASGVLVHGRACCGGTRRHSGSSASDRATDSVLAWQSCDVMERALSPHD